MATELLDAANTGAYGHPERIARFSGRTVTIGFGRNTVLGMADKAIEGVRSCAIRRFFLVGGCDGAKPGRNFYTESAFRQRRGLLRQPPQERALHDKKNY